MQKKLIIAERAARTAGAIVMKQFGRLRRSRLSYKKHNEVVTSVDRDSDRCIKKILKREFPAHAFLSEESGASFAKSDYVWIIDPIDGTLNYVMGVPLFAVEIALAYRGEIIMGVVYNPITEVMFAAERGKGSRVNGRAIAVSRTSGIAHSFNTWTHGKTPEVIRRMTNVYAYFRKRGMAFRNLGCVTLQMCMTASGITDSYIASGMHRWDCAAGALLISEAGGTVTDFSGRPWSLDSKTIVASNGLLHRSLLASVRKSY